MGMQEEHSRHAAPLPLRPQGSGRSEAGAAHHVSNVADMLREHWSAYLRACLLFYGLSLLGMAVVAANPDLERTLRTAIRSNVDRDLLDAYARGAVLEATARTFANNVLLASIVALTLPSLAIPFWGLGLGCVRALLWGLALSPTDPSYGIRFVAQLPTWILEGQGYILAMLATWILWSGVLRLARTGGAGRSAAYFAGLRTTLVLYVAIVPVLGIAAVYEVLASVYLVPMLQGG